MELQFSKGVDYTDDFAGHLGCLVCPACGSEYLHHDRIDVFCRATEDATEGIHTMISASGLCVDSSISGNPSRRRNGTKIEFWCEGCPARSAMVIIQHKGSTFIGIKK